jgi:hypothetical protein
MLTLTSRVMWCRKDMMCVILRGNGMFVLEWKWQISMSVQNRIE